MVTRQAGGVTMILDYESGVYVADSSLGKKYWRMRLYSSQSGNKWGWTTITYRDTAYGGLTERVESEMKFFSQKNVGQSNETSLEQQAFKEMESHFKKKLDHGYVGPNGEVGDRAASDLLNPMLYHPRLEKERFIAPSYIQPKLDGVRCMTDGERFWTRGGKFLPEECTQHIKFDAEGMPDGLVLDGELMMPVREYSFQDTISRAKKYQNDGLQEKLFFNIFDCYWYGYYKMSFMDRWEFLMALDRQDKLFQDGTRFVECYPILDFDSIPLYHEHFMGQGYEGSMIKAASGLYEPGKRVRHSMKHKDFLEEDFEIVGVRDGNGKEEGAAIFICWSAKGNAKFETRPRGTYEQRQEWYRNRVGLLGRNLKVRFQEYSKDGIPRFPIGLAIRDEVEG